MLLAVSAASGGCDFLAYGMYLCGDEPTEKISPEFEDLPYHRVAVVVYADEGVQHEYPYASLHVSEGVSAELKSKLETVETIDPLVIHKYQRQDIHWDMMDKTELGKHFEADYVLFVTLLEFSTREPGSLNLLRGRISADCALYDANKPEHQSRVWETSAVMVRYPTDNPAGQVGDDDGHIRNKTVQHFAEKLVSRFYEHKVPKST
jgi:hypothetical protein